MSKAWTRIAVWLGTGLGLGLSPVAPGTVGSIWGVAIAWALNSALRDHVGWQIAAAVLLTLLAVPICDAAEKHLGRKDDRRIVADEYLTFPLCVIGLPPEPWILAVAFVSNRVFDILKPPPARGLQRLHGGVGIVIDDALACLYSLAVNHLVYWVATTWLMR